MKLKRFYYTKGEVELPEGWDIYTSSVHSFPLFWREYALGILESHKAPLSSLPVLPMSDLSTTYPEDEPYRARVIEEFMPQPDDGFSEACFMDYSEGDEDDMRFCDICTQYVGLAHNHIGETIKEKDISEWANSIHRKCEKCGHEDDIYPYENGMYSSSLDYCTNPIYCEAPWGMEQDHDRWAEDYVEHTKEPTSTVYICSTCGLSSIHFDGKTDCWYGDFHFWVSEALVQATEEGIKAIEAGDFVTLEELEEVMAPPKPVPKPIPTKVGLRVKPVEEDAVVVPKPKPKKKKASTKKKKVVEVDSFVSEPIEPINYYDFEMNNPVEDKTVLNPESEYIKVGRGQFRTKAEIEADPLLQEAIRQYKE